MGIIWNLIARAFARNSSRAYNAFKSTFGRSFARAAAADAAAGTGLGLAAEFAKTAIRGWWNKLWRALIVQALRTKVALKWFVREAFVGVAAYELVTYGFNRVFNSNSNENSNQNSNEGGKSLTSVTINNVNDPHFDQYDLTKREEVKGSGKYVNEQDPIQAVNQKTQDGQVSAFDANGLPPAFSAGANSYVIDGKEVTFHDFSLFVTAARVFKQYQRDVSDSFSAKWVETALATIDKDDNSEYIYEDGKFLDKPTLAILGDEAFLRHQFDTIFAPAMRTLGVGSVSDLKPFLLLATMDPDLFTAVEKSTQIWR